MSRFLYVGLVIAVVSAKLSAADAPATPPPPDAHLLAGTWKYDPNRSTPLSAWDTMQLVIAVDGPRVTLTRKLSAGRRAYDSVTAIDLSKTTNLVPVEMWADNRNIGAYLSGDKTYKVRLRLFDTHILRTSSDIVLATQQGERTVNILCDYKVSVNGQHLTLIELRSTRNEPMVYYFSRVPDVPAGGASKGGQ